MCNLQTLQYSLIRQPESSEIIRHPHRIAARWNLRQAEALELDLVETGEEFTKGIFLQIEGPFLRHFLGQSVWTDLHALELSRFAVLEDRLQVPVLPELVSHQAQFHRRLPDEETR